MENLENREVSVNEKRIRKLTQLYYSRPEIQKNIFEFCKNREISPRYFDGFGKRPDSFQYKGDVFELIKKGATSLHCSEEIWEDPLRINTNMTEEDYDEIRTGWDLLIDIDSKYIDYSKILADIIIKMLEFHGIKNIGIKFSGSKGFHIIIPWKAFPKLVNETKTSDMFPEWARILTKYIIEKTTPKLIERVSDLSRPSKYVKDFQVSKEVLPDLVLVSPRHLFRAPYSLHEKTALSSIVLDKNKILDFELKDANPMKLSSNDVIDFMPESAEGEASELLMQALDWSKTNEEGQEKQGKTSGRGFNFKPIKLSNLSERNFPPCVQNILKGMADGKKRALFILINLFRSVGMDREELEQRVEEWNKKNKPPIKQGYIRSQLEWAFRKNPILPPNCKEFYQGIGVCQPDSFCKLVKNPINYVIRKNLRENRDYTGNTPSKNHPKNKDNFKNNS